MSDSKETKVLHFVKKMLEQSSEDKGLRATLRLAVNPNTESRAWPVLIRWGLMFQVRKRMPIVLLWLSLHVIREEQTELSP